MAALALSRAWLCETCDPAHAGAVMVVVPTLAAALSCCVPVGALCAAGLVVAAAGVFWLGALDVGSPPRDTVLTMLVIGIAADLPWGGIGKYWSMFRMLQCFEAIRLPEIIIAMDSLTVRQQIDQATFWRCFSNMLRPVSLHLYSVR